MIVFGVVKFSVGIILNENFLYEDFDEDFGDFFIEFK